MSREPLCNRIRRAVKELRAYARHPDVPGSLEVVMLEQLAAIERAVEKIEPPTRAPRGRS